MFRVSEGARFHLFHGRGGGVPHPKDGPPSTKARDSERYLLYPIEKEERGGGGGKTMRAYYIANRVRWEIPVLQNPKKKRKRRRGGDHKRITF